VQHLLRALDLDAASRFDFRAGFAGDLFHRPAAYFTVMSVPPLAALVIGGGSTLMLVSLHAHVPVWGWALLGLVTAITALMAAPLTLRTFHSARRLDALFAEAVDAETERLLVLLGPRQDRDEAVSLAETHVRREWRTRAHVRLDS